MNFDLQSFVPPAATDPALSWNYLFFFLFIVTAVFFAVVMIPMVAFIIKYRKKAGRKTDPIDHNAPLEVLWTAIPTVILMVIFAWGWIVYRDLQYRVPANAMEVNVVAESWAWTFQYPDGRIEKNRLVVPVDTPIKLKITSKPGDVLHSFFVPNFRIKKDAVPGIYTSTYFQSKMVGRHQFYCTEYCGKDHSAMFGEVIVLSKEDFELWKFGKEVPLPPWVGFGGLAEKMLAEGQQTKTEEGLFLSANAGSGEALIERGELLTKKMGCTACHSDNGSANIGPSFKGLFGSQRRLHNGEWVVADENYIRESIEFPQAKMVKGFEDRVMPPFPGHLSELELNALVSYIKSVQ